MAGAEFFTARSTADGLRRLRRKTSRKRRDPRSAAPMTEPTTVPAIAPWERRLWTVDDVTMPFPLAEEEELLPETANVVEEVADEEVVVEGMLDEGSVEVSRVL